MQKDSLFIDKAEDVDFDVYRKVPIDGFGMQLMESMGFTV